MAPQQVAFPPSNTLREQHTFRINFVTKTFIGAYRFEASIFLPSTSPRIQAAALLPRSQPAHRHWRPKLGLAGPHGCEFSDLFDQRFD
jgi:hypothetical protein